MVLGPSVKSVCGLSCNSIMFPDHPKKLTGVLAVHVKVAEDVRVYS